MGPKHKRKTPSKGNDNDQDVTEMFSPVSVRGSPTTPKSANLTGSARKVKDTAADLHNVIQKWNNLNSSGAAVVTDMANIKLETILSQSEETRGADKMLPDSLLPLCDKLADHLENMEKLVSRLTRLVEVTKAVGELERHKRQNGDNVVLFHSWDIARIEATVLEITEMYQRELKLKVGISQNICHASDRNTVMFYSSAWIHQPYIEQSADLLLDSLLLETGHIAY